MKITIISNKNGLMTKTFNKKMEKVSVSQLAEGSYKVLQLSNLEQIGIIKKKLKSNQAIILGTPIDDSEKGKIYSRSNYKGTGITRTKDMFENKSGLIMFDFDLREYGQITLKQYRKMLIECDPQLENAEMFLTYGSSAGIKSKKHGETGFGSIHAYCRIDKEMYIKTYAQQLFNNGLNLGYGEIKVNENVFKSYINGVIDLAVLKGDASRIVYEAAPILHKSLKRKVKDDLYFNGGVIEGGIVRKTSINTSYQSKAKDMIHNLKKTYKATTKDKKEVKKRKLDRHNEIYGSEDLVLNDGSTIKAWEVLAGNHIELPMCDPFEPEKGTNKAKIFEQLDLTKRPAMHSFIHGGQMYYFHADLESIPYLVEKLDEEDVFTIVKRDFSGYMLDKAIAALENNMEKTRGAIKKYLRESDTSKEKDIKCTEEGFDDTIDIDTDKERALKQLDNTFYVLEGKNPLYAEIDENGTVHYNTPLKLRETYRDFNTKDSDFITDWIEGGYRKKIKGVRFNPQKTPSEIMDDGYFNLWKGFSCDPVEGDIKPFVEFTRDIICDGDTEHYEFMMDYLAHMVQSPWKKEGIAVILKGKKGVGKDTWIEAFSSIFNKSHYSAVNNMKAITGQFNIHLQHTIICNVGEAFFSGDHAAEGALKTLITEHDMHYGQKYQDDFLGINYTRVFMSTNLDWVVPASGSDERRYFVLEVSDKRRGDLEYMNKFRMWLANGGREALLQFLMDREITHNMYKAPETEALVEQKEHTLRGVEQWLYDCALSGILLGSPFESKFFSNHHTAYELYIAYRTHSNDKFQTNGGVNKKIVEVTGTHSKIKRQNGNVKRMKKFKIKSFIKNFKNKTGIKLDKQELQ